MSEPSRILLVDDDLTIAEPLSRALRREGFTVDAAGTGAEALEALGSRPHLVILDLGLPDMDGLDICRQLRRGGHHMPVLILSARSAAMDIIVGLDAGADEYVTKPFRFSELMARVHGLLHRPSAAG
ncbi:response regulator transcription factor [Luteipulveratus mongoliensis]|uniref:response regulator transcription factor n=1 Tax=Luteipulveratus mongoliensis TaxID=571913 RepID=UPI0006984858|nr:response regulator transcription factor [Luteipulveratus mongoliensis]